ncbi:hypothetical protein KR200_003670 [Drosophila serrata]|nr:hypothetical protein KR200_003670 [Drosophila serrata]
MMTPYLTKLKQLSHRRKMHNLSLSLGQHLSQLERLDRELALARQQETEFYAKLEAMESEKKIAMVKDHEMEVEVEVEAEEAEIEADTETEEMEGPSSDTSSSRSTSASTTSTSGDHQGQGHGPGIGFDQLKLDQAQIQVHCADEPAPGESGDCLDIKKSGIKCQTNVLKLVEKDSEQPILREVPSLLECAEEDFPLPTAKAIRLASKSKLNAEAAAYEMPQYSASDPGLGPVHSQSSQFRLNAKAAVFKPSMENLDDFCTDLPTSGTIAAAAAGAEATYQLLMRQLSMLQQPSDPLAHIHPVRPYPHHHHHSHSHSHSHTHLLQHPHHHGQSHSRGHLIPHPRDHLLPTPSQIPPHVHYHSHNPHGAASQSLLGAPPSLSAQHRNASKQQQHQQHEQHQHQQQHQHQLRSRKEPLPDLFPEVLTLMGELLRPVSYPEIVNILAARLHRPVVELKRHIPHTLHAAVIHGYMSKEGNRYSLLSEDEHMAIKRRNHEAAQRAKELEKEPLSWRKR